MAEQNAKGPGRLGVAMRRIEFPSLDQYSDLLTRIEARGPAGRLAASYLQRAITGQTLVARSVADYAAAIDPFTSYAGDLPIEQVFSVDCLAGFFDTRRHVAPAIRRFTSRVLGTLATAAGLEFPSLPMAVDAGKSTSDDGPTVARDSVAAGMTVCRPQWQVTVENIAAVEAEVAFLLSSVASLHGNHHASLGDYRRLAMVLLCRDAGAVPTDIMSMTLDDVADGRVWMGSVGSSWRAGRVGRRGNGAEKLVLYDLALPRRAALWLKRYIAVAHRDVLPGVAPVFVDDNGDPYDRKGIWEVVSGAGKPTSGERTARRLADPLTSGVSRIELSPARLRHALGMELVRIAPGRQEIAQLMSQRMGVAGRGLAPLYRKALGVVHRRRPPKIDSPDTLPPRSTLDRRWDGS